MILWACLYCMFIFLSLRLHGTDRVQRHKTEPVATTSTLPVTPTDRPSYSGVTSGWPDTIVDKIPLRCRRDTTNDAPSFYNDRGLVVVPALWQYGRKYVTSAEHGNDKRFTSWHAIWRANEGRTRDNVRMRVRWNSACHVAPRILKCSNNFSKTPLRSLLNYFRISSIHPGAGLTAWRSPQPPRTSTF